MPVFWLFFASSSASSIVWTVAAFKVLDMVLEQRLGTALKASLAIQAFHRTGHQLVHIAKLGIVTEAVNRSQSLAEWQVEESWPELFVLCEPFWPIASASLSYRETFTCLQAL